MEQRYIFDFCSLFVVEQNADIKDYIEQSNNTFIIRDYEEAIEYINGLELDEINKGRSI